MADGFFALGNIAIDDLVFADGTTHWCVPGGGAIYAGLGMALWQQFADIAAPLGPDFPVAPFEHRLGFAHCRPIQGTMRNWGLYEDDGTRHFVPRRAAENWPAFSPTCTDLGTATYEYCHLAPMPWPHLRPLVAALRARGNRLISVDVHDRELASLGRAELCSLLHAVDIFLPSVQDTAAIMPGATPLGALRLLRELSPATAVIGVKCGAKGAIVHAAGAADYWSVPSAALSVSDTTGAGDAFCGGFLAGFAGAPCIVEAALQGAVSASFALAAVGPFALAAAPLDVAAQRLELLRQRVVRWPLGTP